MTRDRVAVSAISVPGAFVMLASTQTCLLSLHLQPPSSAALCLGAAFCAALPKQSSPTLCAALPKQSSPTAPYNSAHRGVVGIYTRTEARTQVAPRWRGGDAAATRRWRGGDAAVTRR